MAHSSKEYERGDHQMGFISRCRMSSHIYMRQQYPKHGDIQKTIKFINDEASSVHGNIRESSIFTSESGEWKLGGFDVLSSMNDDDAVIYVRRPLLLPCPTNLTYPSHMAAFFGTLAGMLHQRLQNPAGMPSSATPSPPWTRTTLAL